VKSPLNVGRGSKLQKLVPVIKVTGTTVITDPQLLSDIDKFSGATVVVVVVVGATVVVVVVVEVLVLVVVVVVVSPLLYITRVKFSNCLEIFQSNLAL
jgi:hypothetical protein